jgi:hypothetical protein
MARLQLQVHGHAATQFVDDRQDVASSVQSSRPAVPHVPAAKRYY